MPVGIVWQPAKKRSAAVKKTGFARKIDIFHVQRRKLAQSQAAAVEKFHDRRVAERHPFRGGVLLRHLERRIEQLVDLLPGEDQRQLFLHLRKLQLPERIDPQFLAISQKFVKRAQRGELQAHVRSRLPSFHDREEIIAKIVRSALLPRFFVYGAKSSQCLPIRLQRLRRRISFDCEIAKEFFGQVVFFSRTHAAMSLRDGRPSPRSSPWPGRGSREAAGAGCLYDGT